MDGVACGKRMTKLWFVLGFLAVAACGIPYLLLGQDAIVVYHDQLDGELIAYLLQAKHLWDGGVLPEFLGGASKTALTLPAPACVLLFLFGNGFWALVCMQLSGSLCGYLGMYLLIRETADWSEAKVSKTSQVSFIAMAVGVLYAYLPFLPVYGLSQYGLPLLVWCLIQIRKRKHIKISLIYCAVYVLNSSLVLVGFGVLGVMALSLLVPSKESKKESFLAFGLMSALYILENLPLLGQMLGIGEKSVSHKSEYVLTSSPFIRQFLENLLKGGQHSEDYHAIFLAGVVIVILAGFLTGVGKKTAKNMTAVLGLNGMLCLVAALWDSSPGVAIRSGLGALGAFQLNRLLWMAPCFWYFLLGCALHLALQLWCQKGKVKWTGRVLCLVMIGMLGASGVKVLMESNLKPNLQKVLRPEYDAMSFNDYYAVGVMEQVADYIYECTAENPEDYKVVSLGIDPAAALYHGFYCLDGYSNNYDLEYKHRFREILEPELEKSEYLKNNFDTWGNRLYLFSSECPGYYTIEKNGFYFTNYELNVESLKEMGGKYILSAAYIANAEEQGLNLMRQEPFETQDSYYRIFLYRVE